MKRIVGVVTVALLLLMSLSSTLHAQKRSGMEEKVHQAKQKIHELLKEAEEYAKKGLETKSAELRDKAVDLEHELAAWLEKRAKSRDSKQSGADRERANKKKVIEGLLAGARSLRHLGRIDQAEGLEELADDLMRKLEGRTKNKKRNERGDDKRDLVKRYLRFLRIAVEALVEAKKRESAHRVEHFMHSIELSLEGRRDEKAMKVQKTAPNPRQIINDLEFAVVYLRKKGQKERSQAVLEVLRHLAQAEKARREERGKKDRHDEEDEDDEDDEDEGRIEELETRLKKLERYLEELRRSLKEEKGRR